MILRLFIIFFFSFFIFNANTKASNKEKIINNLKNTSNLRFKFDQKINEEVERGYCIIEYPRKIHCSYEKNNKVLVSNGKSLVIKTLSSYYRYPLEKTPLNLILDKNFLINKIYNLNEEIINQSYINYKIIENDNEIDLFFDLKTFNLIGWQTKDIYQNTAVTLIHSILVNQEIKEQLFKLPAQN